MNSFKTEILKEADIESLLSLQRDNLKQNLDSQTIDSQGFVSFVYDPETIKGMMAEEPQIIIKDGDLIIGYALTTTLAFGETMELMKPLVLKSRELLHSSTPSVPRAEMRYYIMGQVCIRNGYRGLGLFDLLYQGHKEYLSAQYDCVVTEIADDNKRSLAAHRRVGFKTIHEYFDEVSNKHWHIVLWDWQ